MALLGNGGILELSREWPEPMALAPAAITFTTNPVRIELGNDNYWTGDRVLFTAASGIPLDLNGDGYADCPEGHGIYRGSIYELGPARDFYNGPETNENGPHYRVEHVGIASSQINNTPLPASLTVNASNFKTSDRVIFASTAGVPIDFNGDGYADCPSGLGVYAGSYWQVGPARDHTTTENDPYYQTGDDTAAFYNSNAATGLTTNFTAYIVKDANNRVRFYSALGAGATEYVILPADCGNIVLSKYQNDSGYTAAINTAAADLSTLTLSPAEQALEDLITLPALLQFFYYNRNEDTGFTTQFDGFIEQDALGRIRLYDSEISAHNQITADTKPLRRVDCGNFVIARYADSASYQTALNSAANSIKPLTLPSTSQPLSDVITVPSAITATLDDPASRGWLFQADLQEWALDIDAANLDMTAIGETFGENTKALVRGAGSLQFLVDHKATSAGQDSMALLRLVLLTQQGCKSNARFWLYQNRDNNCGQLSGSAYYQCDLLLTNTRINTRADALIAGSSDFVVTGEIAIKIAP
jgi:hypothetical protein